MPAGTDRGETPHLECRTITKAFGGTVALDGVSLAVRPGTVHALVGENGAGKSTLGKIITGVLRADRGELVLKGSSVSFRSPRQALDHGVALVAQELALVPGLSVARNVFLGVEPRRGGFILERELLKRYERLVSETGFALPSDVPVGRLRVAQQQQVEILRALARDAELLVFDEPSAALSGAEARKLHEIIRSLARAGRTVVLVSHFLREVLELADAVSILRDGRLVRTAPAAEETEGTLIAAMLGRSLGGIFPAKVPPPGDAAVVLDVRELVAPGVRGISLTVGAGEIVGLAGLVGAGRSEFARAVYGATSASSGRVTLLGAGLRGGPGDALRAGIALIPESRKAEGLMLGRPVRENVSLGSLPRLSRAGFVDRGVERRRVSQALDQVSVRAPLAQTAATLSGGNQQKLLFARALLAQPRLLIADEPTRGVDIGAKQSIYELIASLARDGMAVLLISSETEELIGLAHRVLVVRAGTISAELAGDEITEAAILEAAFSVGAAA